jgi:hypothetical protein
VDLADLKETALEYSTKKAERLAADKVARSLKTEEDNLAFAITLYCRENGGAGVDLATVMIEYDTKLTPVAQDWDAIHQYIRENDAIDLVHKRLTESAVRLRWDDDIVIPGVGDKITEKIKVTVND